MKVDINNNMPSRISMNVTTARQTQGKTFGESMAGGLQAAGNMVGQGASLVGSVIPGANIVSTAVSSVGALANSGAASASYAATGVVGYSGGMGASPMGTPGVTLGASNTGANLLAGGNSNIAGTATSQIADMSAQNAQMLNVQIAMQRENTMFSSISNVLKTKHDTAKNSVSNIR